MSNSKAEWLQGTYGKAIERAKERQKVFETTGKMPIEPVYAAEDLRDFDPVRDLGFPGEYPFTRGIPPTMYRGRFWTMRQYAGFGTAEESNQRYRYLLSAGQTGLSVAFDLPTQIGYDSDDPMATGEVGKVGVAIDSIEDMLTLFSEIPLDKVTTSMTINATAGVLLALYVAVGKQQGVPTNKLGGTIQNDILKEYITRGTYIYPPKPSMRLITDTFKYCQDNVPDWNTISISGYHIREAGSTAAQEIAFTLADGIEYVNAALGAGQDIDDFAGGQRVVAVVANLRRQVEGDAQAAHSLTQQIAVAGVGFLGRAEPGVLPHGPEAAAVHRRLDAPGVGIGAREAQVVCFPPSGEVAGHRVVTRGIASHGPPHCSQPASPSPNSLGCTGLRGVSRARRIDEVAESRRRGCRPRPPGPPVGRGGGTAWKTSRTGWPGNSRTPWPPPWRRARMSSAAGSAPAPKGST